MAPKKRTSDATASPRRSSSRAATANAKAIENAVQISDDDGAVDGGATSKAVKGKRKSQVKEADAEAKPRKSTKKSPKKGQENGDVPETTTSEGSPSIAKGDRRSKASEPKEPEEESSPRKAKKARESTKSNGDAEADEEEAPRSLSAPPPGGSKMDTFAAEDHPKNMTIADPLELSNTPKPPDTTRITSWNILSFKSSMGKGLTRYLEAEDADVVIMTETKCNEVPMHPRLKELYPHQTWGIGKTKGYAGIAMLCKNKPIKVTTGLPGSDADTKGRIITAEFERHYVIGTYVVNAGEGLKTLEAKKAWQEHFAAHYAQCNKHKPVIWGGDLNVVLDSRDLSNASKKWNKSAGYTEVECENHRKLLAGTATPEPTEPSVDIWRERHPDAVGHYSYYGFRGQCRQKGIGWRLDTFIVPQRIAADVQACEIRHDVYGASDHVPVYIDIKGTL